MKPTFHIDPDRARQIIADPAMRAQMVAALTAGAPDTGKPNAVKLGPDGPILDGMPALIILSMRVLLIEADRVLTAYEHYGKP